MMSMPPEKTMRCPISGGEGVFAAETHEEDGIAYRLYACRECEVQFWWPMKNPGAEWYRHDVRHSSRNIDPPKTLDPGHEAFLKDAPARQGALLDVGCGVGNFLAAAEKKGYRVRGIDFDRDTVAVARDFFGVRNVSTQSLEEIIKEGEKYDIVTFFEVLEHMDDPVGFITKIKSVLKDRGYIALSLPYRNSWDVFKKGDKPPRHFTRWNKEAMRNFLETQGFEVIRIHPFWVSFDFLVTRFHFWFKGIFSFDVVNKMRAEGKGRQGGRSEAPSPEFINFLKAAAKVKDYVLFSVPSAFLYVYLVAMGRAHLGMYALARLK